MKELLKVFIESKPKSQKIITRGKPTGVMYSFGDTKLTARMGICSFVKNKYLWMYSVIHQQMFFVSIEENSYEGDRELTQEEEDIFKFIEIHCLEDNLLELLYEKISS